MHAFTQHFEVVIRNGTHLSFVILFILLGGLWPAAGGLHGGRRGRGRRGARGGAVRLGCPLLRIFVLFVLVGAFFVLVATMLMFILVFAMFVLVATMFVVSVLVVMLVAIVVRIGAAAFGAAALALLAAPLPAFSYFLSCSLLVLRSFSVDMS